MGGKKLSDWTDWSAVVVDGLAPVPSDKTWLLFNYYIRTKYRYGLAVIRVGEEVRKSD